MGPLGVIVLNSLTVSQTLKGSSGLKGFHTLGWRAFAAGVASGGAPERGFS